MADALRPLTLLLGVICLWALSVLILALSGLGSRFAVATTGQTPPRLPAIALTRSQSRLGPMNDYLGVGQRPLMNENRQPTLQLAVNGAALPELDVMLTSVMITPRLQLAILTGNKDATVRRVRVGETIEGSNWRLVQVEPRRATIEGPSGQRVLELRVFNGKGGELPSPSVAQAAAPTAVQPGNAPPSPTSPQPILDAGKPSPVAAQADPQAAQQQQIEAIRRRIEARRAQMRAEAESSSGNDR